MNEVQLYLDPTNLTVKDMLYGIWVHSENDAFRALGPDISQLSIRRGMNKRAKLLA